MLGTKKVVVVVVVVVVVAAAVVVVAAAVVVVCWLQAGNLFRFEQRYTRSPTPISRVGRLC